MKKFSVRSHRPSVLRAVRRVLGCMIVVAVSVHAAEIHERVQNGDLPSVRVMVERDPDLVHLDDDGGRTPLHWACRGDDVEMVEFLLDQGARVDARDTFGTTPLHHLAYRNLAAAMEILLERGAEADVQNHSQKTPLHYAAEADAGAAIRVLVAAGADLEIRDDYGRTALILCARERGSAAAAETLLEGGAEINMVDTHGSSALDLAAWRGKTAMVNLLLDSNATVPSTGSRAQRLLSEAASHGLARLFNAVIEAGGSLDVSTPTGGTLAHEAAAGGSLEILQKLGDLDVDMTLADDFGWTPLHYAARDGRSRCVEWLMAEGADSGARNTMGETPFNVAEAMNATAAMEVIRRADGDVSPARFPSLKGPYLGQEPPGATPRVFAPGIVSSIWGLHSAISFSPDGDMAAWAPMVDRPGQIYSEGGVMMTRLVGGAWTAPDWAAYTGAVDGDVPFFAPTGGRVYFISTRAISDQAPSNRERIWFADRRGDGWGTARPVDRAVNDLSQHWQFSVNEDHDLYFSTDLPGAYGAGDIYGARFIDGSWREPVNLGPPINTPADESTPFIAPDGSYLVLQRDGDLLVSYQRDGLGWTVPRLLPEPINTTSRELCPLVSPDGKYLFFVSNRSGMSHIWWVSASILEQWKPTIEAPPDQRPVNGGGGGS